MKLGFTGTRHGGTIQQMLALRALLELLKPSEVHHGDCVGADERFDLEARRLPGVRRVIHPPVKDELRAHCDLYCSLDQTVDTRDPAHYLERNRHIVDETDCLLAVPKEEEDPGKGGTWYTVRYAKQQGKVVLLIKPDGTVRLMN